MFCNIFYVTTINFFFASVIVQLVKFFIVE